MSHTGIFKITDLTYRLGSEGGLARALQIEATCTACGSAGVRNEGEMGHVRERWSMSEEEPCCPAPPAESAKQLATPA